MTIRKSTGLLAKLLEVFSNLNGGVIAVFTGAPPLSANDAATGTLLYSIVTPVWGISGVGMLAKPDAELWSSMAIESGTAGWFRISSGDPLVASDTMVRIDGTLGKIKADVILSSVAVERGTLQTISQFEIALS